MFRTIVLALVGLSALTAVAQSQQPKTADDYFGAGMTLQRSAQYEKALEQYAAALRLEPKHFGAQVDSGVCDLALKKFESAINAFRTAANLRPDDAHVQFDLGVACAGAGRSLGAIDAFKEAIRLDPNPSAPYKNRAQAYRALGDEINAARDEERAQKRSQ